MQTPEFVAVVPVKRRISVRNPGTLESACPFSGLTPPCYRAPVLSLAIAKKVWGRGVGVGLWKGTRK
jgi:hypothetical protein